MEPDPRETPPAGERPEPAIIPRPEHNISRAGISPNALKVLYRLSKAGYEGYLVGGSVRDLLLGREPKDFDVATDARPEDVKRLFGNCRLIGRRFRLAHVRFGREVIEVATFRAHHSSGDGQVESDDGRILSDNVYGELDEDALRRDFTINALYYNIRDFSVVDFTTGFQDLQAGVLRLIGDPETRLREDPVRMLRVVRFAAKLGFRIDPEVQALLPRLAGLLEGVPPARLFDEILKLFHGGYALETFELLRQHGLYGVLFPESEAALAEEVDGFPATLVAEALGNTDERVQADQPVSPAFLFAAFLWGPVRRRQAALEAEGMPPHQALEAAGDRLFAAQNARVAVPRRYSQVTREIWLLQARLARNTGKRPYAVLAHPRFRAAYDFLLVRARAGEPVAELADWWTRFQEGEKDEQEGMLAPDREKKRRRRRRPRRRRPAAAE